MKKFILAGVMLISGLSLSLAQESPRVCGAGEMIKAALENDPGYQVRLDDLEQFTRDYVSRNSGQRTTGPVLYVIPVVFHIIHNYGYENISKAQVLDAVDIMNKSFQKWYSDSVLVASAFMPIIADVQVEFRLAQIDPSGNCTDGITRTVSSLTNSAGDNVKALVDWPSDKYFNIWVVKNIASGAAGYAYYPGISANIDGVVMRHDYTGGIGTSNGSNYSARSLTHEAGHWLNLAHTWGGTNNPGLAQNCSDDDFVQDTPNTIGVNDFSCDTSQVTCGTLDNVQNYMDYAGCHYMFTEGQKQRMHAALNAPAGNRNNLYTQSNLIATGTNDGYVAPPCQPIADFNRSVRYICTGTSITFNDLSWRSDPDNWQWNFPGGTPSFSTDQNPVVQYNTPGIYDVTLTVSNGGLSNTITGSSMIVVSPATGYHAVPYTEDFENTGPIPNSSDWLITNPAGNGWELTTTAAYSGSHSMRIFNFSGNPDGDIDAFITPGYDLTNITNANLTFRLAFSPRSSSSTDQLKVYASNDCGQQWNLRYTKTGLALLTGGILTSSFVPNSSQWREEPVSINTTSYNNKPSVRFKFEYTQNTGNNIYIDDINITGISTVGIQDVEFLATLSVYPNPSQDEMEISFSLGDRQPVRIDVMDVSGRIIRTPVDETLPSGSYKYAFGRDITAGVYLVRISLDGGMLTQKVIFTR